jgi:hypothetical protein
MNHKPVQLRLEAEEVRRLLQVSLDEDAQQALEFVKTVIAKKVDKMKNPAEKHGKLPGDLYEIMKKPNVVSGCHWSYCSS